MTSSESHYRILVIDDTPSIHDDFRKILAPNSVMNPEALSALTDLAASIFGVPVGEGESEVFTVDSAFQGQEGHIMVQEAAAAGRPYTLAFVDMRMPPGWDGLETIRHLWQSDPSLQVVICTAYSDHGWESIRRKLGATHNLLILKKPFDHVEALQLAHTLCKKWSLNRTLNTQISDLDRLAKRRTQELFRAEELFAQAFEASPLAQCIQSLDDGCIIEVNSAFERIVGVGRTQINDRTPESFGRGLDPERWQSFLTAVSAGHSIDETPIIYAPEGKPPREMRCSGRAVLLGNLRCAIWVIRDVTEQMRLEQQLRQSQKMEAIGQLVAGVAHDFNNLLTIIINYAGFSMEQPGLTQRSQDCLGKVRSAAERAAALTRQLLVFSRQQMPNPLPLDLSDVVLSFREMLTRLIPAHIELGWHCPSGLPIVQADEANMEQVVLNLVVNARDAIHRDGRIDITLATHEQPMTANPERPAGLYVRLSVADNGTGIPPEVLSKIFDPFFTTKEVGKGTGLGLATVDSIAKQHRGWVDVESVPGEGTRFDFCLPAAPAGIEMITEIPTAAPDQSLADLRILYVEDDPVVRQVTQTILERRCNRLSVANDGVSAVSAWRAAAGEVDLLITDMIMPGGISGADLTRQFCSENPKLKVLITSGYSAQLLSQSEQLSAGLKVLPKPYNSDHLIEAINQTLATV